MRKDTLNFTLDQIRCLTSPVRTELLYALLIDGPLTVAELATLVERPAKSLYYQVRLLEKFGLIVQTGTRRTSNREERIYDATADNMVVQPPPLSPEYRREFAKNVQSVMVNASQEFGQALMEADESLDDFQPRYARRLTFRLTPDHQVIFMNKLREMLDYGRELDDKVHGKRFAVAMLVAPMPKRRS